MNKAELIEEISNVTEVSKKEVNKVIDAFSDTIVATLSKNDKVQLVGFGTFETRARKARTGINPTTKEAISIPAKTVPAFKAGKSFREAVK